MEAAAPKERSERGQGRRGGAGRRQRTRTGYLITL